MRIAPLGDPLELLVRGASLSIRKAEASSVVVELVTAHATASSPRAAALEPDLGL
jgi:hypothetical protein